MRRFRLQTAGIVALAFVLALLWLLPAREVRIAVDGGVTTVSSRAASGRAVAEDAGIRLQPGDEVRDAGNGGLFVDRATEARLVVDGETIALRTQAATIGEVLAQAGVTLDEQDSVYRDGAFASGPAPVAAPVSLASSSGGSEAESAAAEQAVTLEVRRAVPYTVVENGQALALRSSRSTVATALRQAGVRVGPGDAVQPALETEMSAGLEVHVEHAKQLVVTVPDGKLMLYTLSDSVGEALAEGGVTLPAEYRLEPAERTPIAAGLAVHVVGITNELVLETERIESYTLYEPDPALPPGAQRVVTGTDGVHYRQYELVAHDGALVSRELASQWYDPEPVDTIIYYSTAPAPAPVAAQVPAASSGEWQDLVCSYDWDCSWALAVIACESGGNPNAYNPAGYVGLFQIWEGHGANLRDPATNIAAAYSLYLSGGAGNWPNCP